GRLETLGRRDRQGKIRGHRIELGEMDEGLAAHPGVTGASCVVVGEDAERQQVAAWVKTGPPARDPDPDASERRPAARPRYMAPSFYLDMESLPTNQNAKVDTAQLRRMAHDAVPGRRPPAVGREQVIAGIWQEVLQVPEIAAEDDFFDLGGNSMLAA